MQTTSHLLMIRPVAFTYNAETAVNNAFQQAGNANDAQQKAMNEFDGFVTQLRNKGVDVTVVNDTAAPHTPDSIFPNNWISFHSDGRVALYPMFAVNRRAERKQHVLDVIEAKFAVAGYASFTDFENSNLFLEGTGSMVLDREQKISYACLSPRTNAVVLEDWCSKMGYRACAFTSKDAQGQEIYHTNVMMCVADQFVVICLDSIPDAIERANVVATIEQSKKSIIAISLEQMNRFAGNMLQVQNAEGEKILVMSTQAFEALTPAQVQTIESHCTILHSSLQTIETNGGGSARCMMAEVFLPLR
jgi:hypothetical protein